MSEVLIKIEMPKNCAACPCACEIDSSCHITGDKPTFAEWYEDGVANCPLIPVPPHGRLIDADALVDSFDPSDFWNPDAEENCFAAIHVVNCAPTIIPASMEE